ncbi:putative Cyclophilin-like domain-containing protein [Lupinus albus]|uniref:Putative Cyclophilin-like domain-containing protein n=1 Tax=Lupinus albus TaxID=3870 RepID=A0A6A4NT45_LUPAL|nr:putative Cyclophilin-like domain-containing protein [Lupinus albus]
MRFTILCCEESMLWRSILCYPTSPSGIKKSFNEPPILQLLPGCAPQSVSYILELLALPHCIGCQIYRAESRGSFWNSEGNHIKKAPFGPPFALIQGTLAYHGSTINDIPNEHCPAIRRGSVAWVGSGPEFFISLANHQEWRNSYTVFGYVISEDMEILEKISQLRTKSEIWNNIHVSVLENPILLRFRRMNTKL